MGGMSEKDRTVACNNPECDYFKDGLSMGDAISLELSQCPKCDEWSRDGELVIVDE